MAALEGIGLQVRVEGLEREVEELHTRLAELERAVAAIVALGQDFWREEAAILLIGAAVRTWRCDARDRNVFFSDVFPCENVEGSGYAKRWVGKSGELATSVAISRAEPLVFSALVEGFVTRELAQSFRLEVDGQLVPWSGREQKTWSAAIPRRPGSARLDFRLSVDTALLPAGKDVTFAFSEIRIAPAAGAEEPLPPAESGPIGGIARTEPPAALRETA